MFFWVLSEQTAKLYSNWNAIVKCVGLVTPMTMGGYIHWNTHVKGMGVATSVSMGVATLWCMDSVYLLKFLYENHAFMTTHKLLGVSLKSDI